MAGEHDGCMVQGTHPLRCSLPASTATLLMLLPILSFLVEEKCNKMHFIRGLIIASHALLSLLKDFENVKERRLSLSFHHLQGTGQNLKFIRNLIYKIDALPVKWLLPKIKGLLMSKGEKYHMEIGTLFSTP